MLLLHSHLSQNSALLVRFAIRFIDNLVVTYFYGPPCILADVVDAVGSVYRLQV